VELDVVEVLEAVEVVEGEVVLLVVDVVELAAEGLDTSAK
jgi:hypothetical protein